MNIVVLSGRLGADVVNVSNDIENVVAVGNIATNEVYTDKSGVKHESVDWHNVIFFGGRGSVALQHLKKGMLVSVQGRINYVKYKGTDGVEYTKSQIVVNDFSFQSQKINQE